MARVTSTSGLTSGDIAGNLVIRENNAKQIEGLFGRSIARALEKIGLLAEGYAKKECPVDTGRLRNSITHQIDKGDKSVYIGTNVEYGPYVELGTDRQKPQPYLRPAASEHGDKYRAVLKSELGG